MPRFIKDFLPHFIVLLLFTIISLLYFSPVLQGKIIFQSDIAQYTGMSQQLQEYREEGKEIYWTDAAFGGMPTYQLGVKYPLDFVKQLDLTIRFLPRPADYLLLYFIGLYILLLTLKIDYKLAFLGAIAFGFSTYLIIILGVGHNAKAHAIAYMPLVLSGILLTFRGKYLYGFLLTTVAMALELVANHFQMTYYLLLLVVCVGVAYFIDALRKKMLPHYFTSLGIMAIGVVLAVGLNATNILATKEYADISTRGKSELTINADGTPKIYKEGLDFEYITEYSYGILESFNLFIPRFMGGGSGEALPEESEAVEALMRLGASPQEAREIGRQVPVYWGDQTIVAAPAYIGAVVIFLAVLALFLVRGRLKWWIVSGFVLSLLLSWGRNLEFLTQLFIDYVPLYNKFRAVSSIQVIIELVAPVLAVVGLHQFFKFHTKDVLDEEVSIRKQRRKKALLWATSITGGMALIFIIFSSTLLSFSSPYDAELINQLGLPFVDALREDRMTLLTQDAIRSLVLVLLAAGVLYLFSISKLKQTPVIALLVALVLFDLVGVDRRYVNNDDFVQARVMEAPFPQTAADTQILEDEGHFRVYDATQNPFNSARASFFHNALGGYHAAKPGRVQELFEFYLSKGDIGMLNMFNVKYIITNGKSGAPVAQRNPYNNGNAWFVENVILANNATEELQQLDSLNTKTTAVIAEKFKEQLPLEKLQRDSTATVELVSHQPEHLVYEASSNTPQLVVFSEIYYPQGWNAYINGKPASHFRANYVLRAMSLPPGNNKIEFKFEPQVIKTGSTITLISSIIFLLLLLGSLWWTYKNKQRSLLK